MICNVGKIDRVVRGLLAVVLIGAALYFVPTEIPKILLLISGVLLIMSASYGVCFVYKVIGVSTAKPEEVK